MKELSVKEKAKRYDEVVEKFDVILNLNTVKESGTIFTDDVIKILPELKESEDERVRKELLKHLKEGADGYEPAGGSEDYKRWLVWFEKRGETFTKKDVDDAYLKGVCDAKHELEKQGEQKPAIKLERDDNGEPVLTPFEAELFSMMSEAWQGYSFGEEVNFAKIVKEHSIELLERAKEQNPAWSEEDEKTIDEAVECLENYVEYVQGGFSKQHVLDLASRVESLKDRYFWKPSDEQMEYLSAAIEESNENPVIESLYKDLKKLREE